MKNRPTIKDIAAEVGVSHTTVSYILNGNKTQKISEETRQAVLEAARRLQYVPNGAARSLRINSSKCVSVALEKAVTQTRFSSLLEGIRSSLHAEGYWLMLFDFSTSGALYPDYLDSVLQRRTDGIIYISSDGNPPPEEWRKVIITNKLPFVACDCCPPEDALASVSFDYERSAFEVGCRLFGEGAHRLLYWRPGLGNQQEHYREVGLRRAAALYPNVELEVCYLPYTLPESSAKYDRHAMFSQICRQFIAQDIVLRTAQYRPTDAVVCSWSIMVNYLAVMLQQTGRSLKIATLSDAAVPILKDCRVLASRSDYLHGGESCTQLLLDQIRGEVTDNKLVIPPTPPQYIEL